MRVLAQPLLNQNDVMQGGNDGEQKGGAQEFRARDPDPADWPDLKQQNEKHRADLAQCIGFAKNARAKVAQSRNGEQDRAGGKDGNITAEDHDRVLPRNLVQDGEHKKHRAQQKLVGDGVQILSQ